MNTSLPEQLVIVSAQNNLRLRDCLAKLLTYVEDPQASQIIGLANLTYSLQIGHVALPCRLAFFAHSLADLREKLGLLLQYPETPCHFSVYATISEHWPHTSEVTNDPLKNAVQGWVNGEQVDWMTFHSDKNDTKSIVLVNYPFLPTSDLITTATAEQLKQNNVSGQMYPLVQQSSVKFVSHFNGQEFFLQDHRIYGEKVLSSVAHLEMARLAVAKTLRTDANMHFSEVVWQRLVTVKGLDEVLQVAVHPTADGGAQFSIESVDSDGKVKVYSSGLVSIAEPVPQPIIDLDQLRQHSEQVSWQAADIYATFRASNMDYGPAYQGLEALYAATDGKMILAKVAIPAFMAGTAQYCFLHPCLLDCALQAAIGLSNSTSQPLPAKIPLDLPFMLDYLCIYAPSPGVAWAVIVASDAEGQDSTIRKITVTLCNEQGEVFAKLVGLSSRRYNPPPVMQQYDPLLYTPIWREATLTVGQDDIGQNRHKPDFGYSQHTVLMVGGFSQQTVDELKARLNSPLDPENNQPLIGAVEVELLAPLQGSIIDDYQTAAIALFRRIQGVLQTHPRAGVLVQLLVAGESFADQSLCLAGLSGLLKSAHLENHHLLCQCIRLSLTTDPQTLGQIVQDNAQALDNQDIRYHGQQRQIIEYSYFDTEHSSRSCWQDQGVYLITGGLSGFGFLLAESIASQASNVVLVLSGLSVIGHEDEERLSQLRSYGARVDYRPADVTDAAAVAGLIAYVIEQYDKITSIVHNAGGLAEHFIIDKPVDEFERVLSPKVAGLVNLDHASQNIALAQFICFSSTTALGGSGLVDSATANSFMDGFMHHRQALVAAGKRHGHSLSVNWPLWTAGAQGNPGANIIDDAQMIRMREQGLVPLASDRGLAALAQILLTPAMPSPLSQVAIFAGRRRAIESLQLNSNQGAVCALTAPLAAHSDSSGLHEGYDKAFVIPAKYYFCQALASIIHLSADEIDVDIAFIQLGLDSALMIRFTAELELTFGQLPHSLLFEYTSISALTDYFIAHHGGMMVQVLAASTSNRVGQKASAADQSAANNQPNRADNDIAIIGLSGRYPQANNINQFWQNLKQGKDCIAEIPPLRWDLTDYFDPDKNRSGTSCCKWGGFIDGIDEFDPMFFNISPREAKITDPQERLFLQCAYETIEDAGYTRETLAQYHNGQDDGVVGNVGVFVGVTYHDYQLYGAQAQVLGEPTAIASIPSAIANRVSYFCNWHGPSLVVDTMCSASLTAVALACQSLRSKGCDLAIAGGVNVTVHVNKYLLLAQEKFASTVPRCVSFGEGGDGYVPGEAIGAILLRPMAAAVANHDQIYGIIKGVAVNHGGKANTFYSPDPAAQRALVVKALRDGNINPRDISYVEAHGSGTPLGDPIEITGLSNAFAEFTPDKQFCAIGSVKSNIGHCEGAAGMAGLTKVLLQMKYQQLVPSLHSQTLNPYIDFIDTPFSVQQRLQHWPRPQWKTPLGVTEKPRIAAISSFGAGGSNAHLIIAEYQFNDSVNHSINGESAITAPALIVLSARTEQQLVEVAERLLAALSTESYSEEDLVAIAATLQLGREAMAYRLGLIAANLAQLGDRLQAFIRQAQPDPSAQLAQLDEQQGANWWFGRAGKATSATDQTIKDWLAQGEYDQLLTLWVSGLTVNWGLLYGDQRPRKLSLPTYPFSRERYWYEMPQRSLPGAVHDHQLHPLLQQNQSNVYQLRFSSTFDGSEFFLADHQINGEKVLPDMAFLEMARVAVATALQQPKTIILTDFVWLQPYIHSVEDNAALQVGLLIQPDGQLAVDIYSEMADGALVVYCQCNATVDTFEAVAPHIDLAKLTQQSREVSVTMKDIYRAFEACGVSYGPSYQGLVSLRLGASAVMALAQVQLPQSLSSSRGLYQLHPVILTSALQGIVGLSLNQATENLDHLFEPLTLQRLTVYGQMPKTPQGQIWVLVRMSADHQTNSKTETLDISLMDEQGRVWLELSGFSSSVATSTSDDAQERGAESAALATDPAETLDDQQTLSAKALEYLTQQLAETLHLSPEHIEPDEPMEQYGIDSATIIELTLILNQRFGDVSSTLFYEVQTVGALRDYFIENHGEKLSELLSTGVNGKRLQFRPRTLSQQPRLASGVLRVQRDSDSQLNGYSATPVINDIAIIGLSGRYAKSNTMAQYWHNLKQGIDCVSEVPLDRWRIQGFYHQDKNHVGTSYSKWGGFIDGVDEFDAQFFKMAPSEAELTDPQERLFLQCVYETIEDAGYTRHNLAQQRFGQAMAGNVGVFVGVMYSEYQLFGAQLQTLGHATAMGGDFSSIANRVSYYCHWMGPSMAVDTMCSSSLTAIHLACQSIKNAQCEVAVAGGINLSIHPNKYLLLSQDKFVSSNGRCVSFGEGGDGYVPGEGVGAILLKAKGAAIADNDHIYGIIKGTAINHGGKTNGFTVPNPIAQQDLISKALKDAKVDPRHISYIEAHGTGTALGDPIEVAGLAKAFGQYTADKQFCAIGSAKATIGHCEGAAGIAGVAKVLLQMKHQQLVPSLHSEQLNAKIDFSQTPFVVQHTLAPWSRPMVDGPQGRHEVPRIAGISSFGAGGSNGHVIIEEYCAPADNHGIEVNDQHPALIVLSARTLGQLVKRAQQLKQVLIDDAYTDQQLPSIAWTLQHGREPMEFRLAFCAANIAQLAQQLQRFIAQPQGADDLYFGRVSDGKAQIKALNKQLSKVHDLVQLLTNWLTEQQYATILQHWVMGLKVDWALCYTAKRPRKLTLPTYPFSKRRHWFEVAEGIHLNGGLATSQRPSQSGHYGAPLLQVNESDAFTPMFSNYFNSHEFFLADHQVNGQRVLPGVAHLEMARAAMTKALRGNNNVIISDVVWMQPLIVDQQGRGVRIVLTPSDERHARYQIESYSGEGATEETDPPVIYSQGKLQLTVPVTPPRLGLYFLHQQTRPLATPVADIYQAFKQSGLNYGAGHQGITAIRLGQDPAVPMVLAELSLPEFLQPQARDFYLHPCIMDSALQAAIYLAGDPQTTPMALPFALSQLAVYGPTPSQASVWARYSDNHQASSLVSRVDITICDSQGQICVEFSGYTSRRPANKTASKTASKTKSISKNKSPAVVPVADQVANQVANQGLQSWLYQPQWLPCPVQPTAQAMRHEVIICGSASTAMVESLSQILAADGVAVGQLQMLDETLATEYSQALLQLFEYVQGLLKSYPRKPLLIQLVVVANDIKVACLSGLGALLATASLESSKINYQCITVEGQTPAAQLASWLLSNARDETATRMIRYAEQQRQVMQLAAVTLPPLTMPVWDDNGVYLITGGMGGLGLLVAQHIASQCKTPNILLVGRRPLAEQAPPDNAVIAGLIKLGAKVDYQVADVASDIAVVGLIGRVMAKYGRITGVIHGAGVIADDFMIKKTVAQCERVLAAKVAGLENLDLACQNIALKYFITFSSTSALGNIGQGDYAAANAFMDAYIEYRGQMVLAGQRQGQSLSLNWPLWAAGGMQVDQAVIGQLRHNGIVPLASNDGLTIIEQSIGHGISRLVVIAGERSEFETKLRLPFAKDMAEPTIAE